MKSCSSLSLRGMARGRGQTTQGQGSPPYLILLCCLGDISSLPVAWLTWVLLAELGFFFSVLHLAKRMVLDPYDPPYTDRIPFNTSHLKAPCSAPDPGSGQVKVLGRLLSAECIYSLQASSELMNFLDYPRMSCHC